MASDIGSLSDEELREQLIEYGVNVGPIVSSTRLFYEKKLGKLIDSGGVPPQLSETEESEDLLKCLDRIECVVEPNVTTEKSLPSFQSKTDTKAPCLLDSLGSIEGDVDIKLNDLAERAEASGYNCNSQRKLSEKSNSNSTLSDSENDGDKGVVDYLKLRSSDDGKGVNENSAENSISKRSSENSSETEISEEWHPENDTESNYSSTDESFDWNDSGSEGSSCEDEFLGKESQSDEDENSIPLRLPHRKLFDCVLSASATNPFDPEGVDRQTCVSSALDDDFVEKELTDVEVCEIKESVREVLDKHTIARLSKCSMYSVVVQELGDQFNGEKFSLFVQYLYNGEMKMEFLAYLDRGSEKADIAEQILNECKKFGIIFSKVISVGSDGAPDMWKLEGNVFSLLKLKAPSVLPVYTDAEHITSICRHAVSDKNMISSYSRLLPIIFHRIAWEMRDKRSRKVASVIETFLKKYIDPRWVLWETSYDGLKALMMSYRAIVSLLWTHSFVEDEENEVLFVSEHQKDPGSDCEEENSLGSAVTEYTVPAFTAIFMDILTILIDLQTGIAQSVERGYSYIKYCCKKGKENLDQLKNVNGCNYGAFLSCLKAEAGNLIYDKVKLRRISVSNLVDEARLELVGEVSDCLSSLIPQETLEVFEAFCVIEPAKICELTEDEVCRYAMCLSQQFEHIVDGAAFKNELQEVRCIVKDMEDKEASFTEFASQLLACYKDKLPQVCLLAEIALCLPVKFPKGESIYRARCHSVEQLGRLSSDELTIALRIATCQDLYKSWKSYPADEAFDHWQSRKFANEEEVYEWLAKDEDDKEEEEEEEEDEEVQFKYRQPEQHVPRPAMKPQYTSTPIIQEQNYTPVTQARVATPTTTTRRNVGQPDSRQTTANKPKGTERAESASRGGISMWIKLLFVLFVSFLIYLVIINMNPSAENKIPLTIGDND